MIGRLFNRPAPSLSQSMLAAAAKEAGRVARGPRRQPGTLSAGGRTIGYADLHSFYHQANQIFGDRLYDFETTNHAPVIVDCGAHIGLASAFFKERYPAARIRAYEADAGIAAMCAGNLAACGFSDVEVTAAAVWTNDAGVSFVASADDAGHVAASGGIQIPSVRLRNLLQEGAVDLLKLDIEGAEFEVLPDCGDALRGVRRLIVEVHAFDDAPPRVAMLLGTIEQQGFRYVLSDLHQATWLRTMAAPPFEAAPTDKYYFTVFAWQPDGSAESEKRPDVDRRGR